MRAVEVMRIEHIESTRLQQQRGLIKTEHVSPQMWESFQEHDALLVEEEDSGPEPD